MTSPLRLIWLATTLVAILASGVAADDAFNPAIRIKLVRFFPASTQQIVVSSSGPFVITDANGTSIVQAQTGAIYQFSDVGGANVSIASPSESSDPEESQAGALFSSTSFTIQPAAGGLLSVSELGPIASKHSYRGNIIVTPGLSIVNSLPLEDYLKGVLKPEIGAGAPTEALKAQAIAARTYTIRNMGKIAESNADMDDTTRTQSYLGADGETPDIDQAILSTTGQVLLYNGQPINAVYSTDCGGETGAGTASEPYLAPVSDPECASEPPWQLDLSAEELGALLGSVAGVPTDKIDLRVVQTDSSGRASLIKVVQGDQVRTMSGVDFRKLVGYDRLKSTLFRITKNADGSLHITGQGWGHGMGLCQRGAIYMAQHAELCNDILLHYYTGVQIGALVPGMISPVAATDQVSATPKASSPPDP